MRFYDFYVTGGKVRGSEKTFSPFFSADFQIPIEIVICAHVRAEYKYEIMFFFVYFLCALCCFLPKALRDRAYVGMFSDTVYRLNIIATREKLKKITIFPLFLEKP